MRHLILLLLLCVTAQAQWPQGKNSAYLKLGTWNQHSVHHFETNGNISEPGGLRTYFIPALYARVGIDDKWTVTGFVPVVNTSQFIETTNGGFTIEDTNLGDINIFVERLLLKLDTGFHVGAELGFGLPTGFTGIGLSGFPSPVGSGDGEFNQIISLKVGSGFKIGEQNLYYKASLGYNNRTQGFLNEYRWSAETGTTFNKLFVLSRITNITALNKENITVNANNIFGNGIEKRVLGFEATYNLTKHWGISAGYNRFLSGTLVFSDPSYTYGVVYQF